MNKYQKIEEEIENLFVELLDDHMQTNMASAIYGEDITIVVSNLNGNLFYSKSLESLIKENNSYNLQEWIAALKFLILKLEGNKVPEEVKESKKKITLCDVILTGGTGNYYTVSYDYTGAGSTQPHIN